MRIVSIESKPVIATEVSLKQEADTSSTSNGSYVTRTSPTGSMKIFPDEDIRGMVLETDEAITTFNIEYANRNDSLVTIQQAALTKFQKLSSYDFCDAAYIEFEARDVHRTIPKDSSTYNQI
jgi:hypothetical protein